MREQKKTADEAAAMKCQYVGCEDQATEFAVGYDQNGDDHVYQVCLKHAAELEPQVFKSKYNAGQS